MDNNECIINGIHYKCRICFDPGSEVYSLNEICSDTKTWRDLVKEVAQLETSTYEPLPRTVCSKCLDKLITFYDFILQVKRVNAKYIELLTHSKDPLEQDEKIFNKIENYSNCSYESDIDVPHSEEEFITDIKMEMKSDYVDSSNNDNQNDFIDDNSSSSSSAQRDYVSSSTLTDKYNKFILKKINNTERKSLKNFEIINNRFVCPICKQTFTLQKNCRRHVIQQHYIERISNEEFKEIHKELKLDRNKVTKVNLLCGICGQGFKLRSSLIQHTLRKHSGQPLEGDAKSIEQVYGYRLYCKPTAWRRVECKLCSETFPVTKLLQKHLEIHRDINTLDHLNELIIQQLFPGIKDLDKIKEIICTDICQKNYSQYYMILNKYSYEMSISDTEVEDLDEDAEEFNPTKYKCELCAQEFNFKYQVFSHLKNEHLDEKISLKCNYCRLEFISTKMYDQHLETHCNNMNKVLQCTRCPGRFIWAENLKNHNCPLNIAISKSREPQKTKQPVKEIYENIIRCALCPLSFTKIAQLRQHMPLHADGTTDIDWKNSIYIKSIKSKIDQPHVQKQITKMYSISQISKFYQIIDKEGNELHISDSDSSGEESNDCGGDDENVKNQYDCDVCKEAGFKKRKKLLRHQEKCHNSEKLPFDCKNCNQQFVSTHLLQQHLKRLCWNDHRRKAKQCEYCNARFIWPISKLRHIDVKHSESNDIAETSVDPTTSNANINVINNTTTTLTPHNSSPIDELPINTELQMEPTFLYYCLMCPRTFFSIDYLNNHLLSHRLTSTDIKIVESIVHSTWWPHGEKKIECKICDRTFKTMIELKNHFSPSNLQNFCADQHSLTNYSITNQKGFELHLELDSETETEDDNKETVFRYKCCMCNKSFSRKYQVTQHQRAMHNYELIELRCERCIFRTVSQTILDYHKATQCFNTEKAYKCHQCNFKFMWQENLTNHMRIYHTNADISLAIYNTDNQKTTNNNDTSSDCNVPTTSGSKKSNSKDHPYKCSLCDKSFLNVFKLNIHKRLHTQTFPFKCSHCPRKFNLFQQLKLHATSHTAEKPFKCNVCNKKFACKEYLKSHCRLLGHDDLIFPPANITSETCANSNVNNGESDCSTGKQLCPICGKYLSIKTHFADHIRTHTGERPFKCDLCESSFKNKTHLRLHRRLHTDERPYKCSECQKAFNTGTKLRIHYRLHTGNLPYKCSYCEKKFNKKGNLTLHTRIHTGERPFVCEICDERFASSQYLKKHCLKKDH